MHAPNHLVREGQELCKAPRLSHSFKNYMFGSPPFQKCYKGFWFGAGGTWHTKPNQTSTHTSITKTRTRSFKFKQKNLRASRADRTKSTSLPLFIVSLADRPILPANSTIFWTVADFAQLPPVPRKLSLSPPRPGRPLLAPHRSLAASRWAMGISSSRCDSPFATIQQFLSPLIPKQALKGRSNFPLHTRDPPNFVLKGRNESQCILFTGIYLGIS